MIDLGANYKNIESREDGEFIKLPAGGYVCIVTNATVRKTKNNSDMLVLELDIAEGAMSKVFKNSYYPPKYYKVIFDKDGNVSPYFKRLLEQFEESNANFKIADRNLDERTLIDLKIGVIFQEEEYLNSNQEIKTSVKPYRTAVAATIREGEYKIPPLKKLNPADVPKKEDVTPSPDDDFNEVDIDDSKLPF